MLSSRNPSESQIRTTTVLRNAVLTATSSAAVFLATVLGVSDVAAQPPADANEEAFVPAIQLLPSTAAGLVRIPDLPKFCDAAKQTQLGRLVSDPAMEPFLDSQRKRAKTYLKSLNDKTGLDPEDLYDVASGEVVFAWLPFDADRRRPFALAVVVDVRDRVEDVQQALVKIDTELKTNGWSRRDATHQGQALRIYNHKPKPGQLKIEEIAIHSSAERLIAADRQSVVTDLIDAVAAGGLANPIASAEDFKTILTRSGRDLREPAQAGGGQIAAEWFARPFSMGRIVRNSLDVDRGSNVDFLKLMENQGFDAIKAAGGIALLHGKTYDILHKGYVLAPPTAPLPQRYQRAAQMLQFPNELATEIPTWIPDTVAALTRVCLKLENAFWASESLVNEAVGDDIFRDMIEGIKEDRDGPQIDVEKNVLPNLSDRILVLSDNKTPITLESERLLVAVEVTDGAKIKTAIEKMMQAEPDATKLAGPGGIDVYRVQRSDEAMDELDDALFDDFGNEDISDEDKKPLLNHWAIALVPAGPGSKVPYLMVSSDDKFLGEVANQILVGGKPGLGALQEIQQLRQHMKELGADPAAMERVVRTRLSLRAKYELLRQKKLKDSDSIASSVFRRILQDEDEPELEKIETQLLPPLNVVDKYFPNGASFFSSTEDGWSMTAFYLNRE